MGETTLKSDTEPNIIAFRNRVAEELKSWSRFRKCNEGRQANKRLIVNTVMQVREIIRTIECYIESSTQEQVRDDSAVLPWMVEHAGTIV